MVTVLASFTSGMSQCLSEFHLGWFRSCVRNGTDSRFFPVNQPFCRPTIHHQPAPVTHHCHRVLVVTSLTWQVLATHGTTSLSSRFEPPRTRCSIGHRCLQSPLPSHRTIEKLLVSDMLSFVMVMIVALVRRQRVHKVSCLLSALYCYTESGEWTRPESEFSQTGHEEPRARLCSPNGQLPWCLVGTPIKSTEFPSTTAFLQNLCRHHVFAGLSGNVHQSRRLKDATANVPCRTRTQEVFPLETSYHHHNRCIDVPLCSWKTDGRQQ